MKLRAVFSVALALSASGMFGVLTNTATAAPSASEQTCRACHDMNDKKVGPAFRAIAASYRDDPAALAKIKKALSKAVAANGDRSRCRRTHSPMAKPIVLPRGS